MNQVHGKLIHPSFIASFHLFHMHQYQRGSCNNLQLQKKHQKSQH